MKHLLRTFLMMATIFTIPSLVFASDYECQASYTESLQGPTILIPLKRETSPDGNLAIGGRISNIVVLAEIDEATDSVKATIKRDDQILQTSNGFSPNQQGGKPVFQVTLTTASNAIAGPGKFVSLSCSKN